MDRQKRLLKNDDGAASIVEYAIVLPLCFLVIAFIFLFGFFLNQKAVVESAGERGLLVAMKMYNDPSATNVYEFTYGTKPSSAGFGGSDYNFGEMRRDPYRYWGNYRTEEISSSVRNYVTEAISSTQLSTVKKWASPPSVEYTPNGGLLGNNICVTVTQKYKLLPIVFGNLLDIGTAEITTDSYMNVVNQTEFIRNTDFVCDLIEQAGGDKVVEKVAGVLDSITKFFKGN